MVVGGIDVAQPFSAPARAESTRLEPLALSLAADDFRSAALASEFAQRKSVVRACPGAETPDLMLVRWASREHPVTSLAGHLWIHPCCSLNSCRLCCLCVLGCL